MGTVINAIIVFVVIATLAFFGLKALRNYSNSGRYAEDFKKKKKNSYDANRSLK